MQRIWSLRGATSIPADSSELMEQEVKALIEEILEKNEIKESSIVNIVFSQTADLVTENPARVLRKHGFKHTPLFCSQEPSYPDTLDRMVRCLVTYYADESHRPKAVYRGEAKNLRKDLFED